MLMTPILPGKSARCRDVLRGFNQLPASPLARIPDVHFARWVVIDRVRLEYACAPKRPSRLQSEYLLFSADLTPPAYRVDALPHSFFRHLAQYIPAECEAVWENCWGFPGVQDVKKFVDYLKDSQIEVGLYFAAFPDLTPAEIVRALKVRKELSRFVLSHQNALANTGAHAQLQAEYLRESASW
jgi:hypothetical protein